MDTELTFPISAVLPPTARGAALARFLILARQAEHLYKVLPGPASAGDGGDREAKFILAGCFIGSLKELADAFRDMHSQGFLKWVEDAANAPTDLKADVAAAIASTDKRDANSLYSRLLVRVRNSAGFHVSRNDVEGILSTLAEMPVKAATVSGPNQQVQSIPVVEMLVAFLLLNDQADAETFSKAFADAQALYLSLRNVAHDLYFLDVRLATEMVD